MRNKGPHPFEDTWLQLNNGDSQWDKSILFLYQEGNGEGRSMEAFIKKQCTKSLPNEWSSSCTKIRVLMNLLRSDPNTNSRKMSYTNPLRDSLHHPPGNIYRRMWERACTEHPGNWCELDSLGANYIASVWSACNLRLSFLLCNVTNHCFTIPSISSKSTQGKCWQFNNGVACDIGSLTLVRS